MIVLLSVMVREQLCSEVQQSSIFLICHESKDVAKYAVVLRFVLDGIAHERFLLFTPLHDLSADGIADAICQGIRLACNTTMMTVS